MKKRILPLLLALALCLGLAAPAFAADSDFVVENGVLTGYTGPGGDVVIPDGVTSIGDLAFYRCTSLTSVTIPDSVTEISTGAFNECTNLTSVIIPDSVTSIGAMAFYLCASLTGISIPDGVTEIHSDTFFGCTSLTSAALPAGITQIDSSAFQRCESLASINIPDSVTSIGEYAFSGCASLTDITIPEGVSQIGSGAFTGCTGLTDVTIPNSTIYIGASVFSGCTGLTSATLSESTTHIYPNLFFQCSNLTDIYYPSNQMRWDTITIDDYNDELLAATIHFGKSIIEPMEQFTDLNDDGYYLDAVKWAVNLGITTGRTETTFQPTLKCSHAEILTFLWRAAGMPLVDVQIPFHVEGYYADAARWAYSKGMIGEEFVYSASCTRADAVNYIWMAFKTPYASYDGRFEDVPDNSPYAMAVAWAVANEVTTGTTDTKFAPGNICTRGQIVTFLYRAYTNK